KKDQVELLSQHDWLKIGFKMLDGSGSDGYLDPDSPPTFFTNLVKSFDTDNSGELSCDEIQSALKNSSNAEQLYQLIVKHRSEWYEKSESNFYTWLDKRMTIVGLPRFDALVDHEKERIDNLEWMQSVAKLKAAKLKLGPELWHVFPLAFYLNNNKKRAAFPKSFTRAEFIAFVYESAKESQEISRVPAEITAAQAILETGYGKSVPIDVHTGVYSYNLFGIKAHGHPDFVEIYTHEYEGGRKIKVLDKFRAYKSFEDSISGRADFFVSNKRYHSLFESGDPVKWAQGLKDKGYATDPEYANKLISIMKVNGWVK
ncbi:glucosaminidase domain-containing protein, partial [Plesiomonas shigelloides]|uniref:glucosaminidase domain-containing protein n=1 Tax=Plesiomonas shigelloides TaxID=703 RepID=UPI0022485305